MEILTINTRKLAAVGLDVGGPLQGYNFNPVHYLLFLLLQ
jgi:hypothetical protein